MDEMTADDAVQAVRSRSNMALAGELTAQEVPNYPEYWYISMIDNEAPLIGGTCFVVSRADGLVTEVPGSKPPRLNCEAVRQSSAP